MSSNHLRYLVDRVIFKEYEIDVKFLGLYRIIYCLFTMFFLGVPNYSWLIGIPDLLFNPPHISIPNLFTGFPSAVFLYSLTIINVILLVNLLFGYFTKISSIALFFSLLLGQSFAFSFGKIDHSIIWLLIPLVMAFCGWGNSYSIDAKQSRLSKVRSWPLCMFALLLAFAMFTASIPKIIGWHSTHVLAVKSLLIYNNFHWKRAPLFFNQIIGINNVFFWKFLDYITIIFEVGFIVFIFNRKLFQIFVFSAVFFHVFVFLTFGISFAGNLIAYLIFIDWNIFEKLTNSSRFKNFVDKFPKKSFLIISYLIAAVFLIFFLIIDCDYLVKFTEKSLPSVWDLCCMCIMGAPNEFVKTIIIFTIGILFSFVCLFYELKQVLRKTQILN